MRDDDALANNPHVSRKELEALHAELFNWSLTRCDFDRAAAEDLMQTVYVEVLSGKARFDRKSSLKTFLFGTVQMLARSRYRRLKNRMKLLVGHHAQIDQASQGVDGGGRERPDERVWLAVRDLPARQRDITELVFCRDMTIGAGVGGDGCFCRHRPRPLRACQEGPGARAARAARRGVPGVGSR